MSGAEQARAVQIVGEWLTELKRPVTLDEILDRWRQTRPDCPPPRYDALSGIWFRSRRRGSRTIDGWRRARSVPQPDRLARRHGVSAKPEQRSAAQRDRDRLLYSNSLRRLGEVTQVADPTDRPCSTHASRIRSKLHKLAGG